MGFLPVTPLLYMDFANITTAMPGRAPQQPLLFQATPNADAYGLAGEVQPMAAAVAWTQPTAGDLNGTVIRPSTLTPANLGVAVVNGIGFPVFHPKDFINLLADASSGTWKRLRQGDYVGGDNGGYTPLYEDPKGNLFQRLETVSYGGDNGSQLEWVGRSPFGLSQSAMQRHFQAGDRGNVMAGAQGGFTDVNFWPEFDGDGNLTGLTIKSSKREGTYVPYVKGPGGTFAPDPSRAFLREYYTNNGDGHRMLGMIATFAVGWMVDPITTLKDVNEFMFSLYEDSQTTRPSIAQPSPQLQDPITGLFQAVPPSRGPFLA
jgi:hypothetical protein